MKEMICLVLPRNGAFLIHVTSNRANWAGDESRFSCANTLAVAKDYAKDMCESLFETSDGLRWEHCKDEYNGADCCWQLWDDDTHEHDAVIDVRKSGAFYIHCSCSWVSADYLYPLQAEQAFNEHAPSKEVLNPTMPFDIHRDFVQGVIEAMKDDA